MILSSYYLLALGLIANPAPAPMQGAAPETPPSIALLGLSPSARAAGLQAPTSGSVSAPSAASGLSLVRTTPAQPTTQPQPTRQRRIGNGALIPPATRRRPPQRSTSASQRAQTAAPFAGSRAGIDAMRLPSVPCDLCGPRKRRVSRGALQTARSSDNEPRRVRENGTPTCSSDGLSGRVQPSSATILR